MFYPDAWGLVIRQGQLGIFRMVILDTIYSFNEVLFNTIYSFNEVLFNYGILIEVNGGFFSMFDDRRVKKI